VIRGRVLDVGCGAGEHVLLAAQLGLDVTGLVCGDVRHLGQLGAFFDTVLDCELFHALTGPDRHAYVAGLRAVLRPGGRYFMLCYRNAQRDVPHRVRREDIRAAFADGWQVDAIDPVTIETNIHPGGVHGWPAALSRTTDRKEGAAMLTGQARIETGRASRYLVQLCEHLNQMPGHDMHQAHTDDGAPPSVERVERSDDTAVITFDCGRCTLLVTAESLTLRVEAADVENRRRIQDMLTRRVQTIGRRDHLEVTWN
jgi:hypothetical protein